MKRLVLVSTLAIFASSLVAFAGDGRGLASIAPKVSVAAPTVNPDTTPGDWPQYTHDARGSGFAASESTISPANASTMGLKWRFGASDIIFSQATVANGMVFFNDNSGREHALSAATGQPVWASTPNIGETFGPTHNPPGPGSYTQGPASTAAYETITGGTVAGANHVLYVAGGLGDIFALNADTGAILWQTNITNPAQGGFTWTSPMLVGNNLYVGIASEADRPLNPGEFVAMNAITGGVVATATMTPAGGKIPNGTAADPALPNYPGSPVGFPCVGGGIWGSPTYDPNFGAGGTIFVATGTFNPNCSIAPTLEEAIVAFDPATLAVRDHWQIASPLATPDADFGSVPTLFDAPIAGTSGHMLGVANKDGNFYVLDRQNLAAGPKWHVQVGLGGGDPQNAGTGPIAPAAYDGKLIYDAAGVLTVGGVACKSVITAMVPVSGAVAWQHCFSAADDGVVLGPVTVANGVVIVGEGKWIKGVSAADGSVLFTFSPSAGPVHTGPTVANGVVYAGDSGSQMVALTPSNLAPQADLAITKTAPAAVQPGATFPYSISVVNHGPAAATGVKVTDSLPAGTTFVSASAGCGNTSGTVTCDLATITSGATVRITINVTAPPSTGTVNNTASVKANEADPNNANNSASAFVTVSNSAPPSGPGSTGPGFSLDGYWLVATDGGIFNFGAAQFLGSTGSIHLNQPIVGMAPTPTGNGYWLVATDGGIFSFGDAAFLGSTGSIHLNKPIVGMAATPSGNGYWLVASDGGIFNFGDAAFLGSAGSIHLNKPIVGMAPSASGNGYWLVATDGGIFNYGDAAFLGSAGAIHLNQPIVGMAPSASGNGYWLVATDGGIFNYGDAAFFGSTGSIHLNKPIVGMS